MQAASGPTARSAVRRTPPPTRLSWHDDLARQAIGLRLAMFVYALIHEPDAAALPVFSSYRISLAANP